MKKQLIALTLFTATTSAYAHNTHPSPTPTPTPRPTATPIAIVLPPATPVPTPVPVAPVTQETNTATSTVVINITEHDAQTAPPPVDSAAQLAALCANIPQAVLSGGKCFTYGTDGNPTQFKLMGSMGRFSFWEAATKARAPRLDVCFDAGTRPICKPLVTVHIKGPKVAGK